MSETSARVEADILYKLEKEVICLSLLSVMLSFWDYLFYDYSITFFVSRI